MNHSSRACSVASELRRLQSWSPVTVAETMSCSANAAISTPLPIARVAMPLAMYNRSSSFLGRRCAHGSALAVKGRPGESTVRSKKRWSNLSRISHGFFAGDLELLRDCRSLIAKLRVLEIEAIIVGMKIPRLQTGLLTRRFWRAAREGGTTGQLTWPVGGWSSWMALVLSARFGSVRCVHRVPVLVARELCCDR